MNRREQAILSLFYDEGQQEVTPAFLAYRMRMRTSEASDVLDGLVREGILDIHVSPDGYISYTLPPSEQHRLGQGSPLPHLSGGQHGGSGPSARSQPGPFAHPAAQQAPPSASAPPGADATPGYGAAVPPGARSMDDGTDGSVWGLHSAGWTSATPQTAPPPAAVAPTAAPTATAQRTPHELPPGWSRPGESYALVPTSQNGELVAEGLAGPRRMPVLAAGLSLIFPGLGQFYNGEFGKGLLLLFSSAFLLFFYLFWLVWIWSVIDAYMVAEYRNQLSQEADDDLPKGYLPDR